MNLGEFIIKIGTQGDLKGLDEAITKMSEAEKKSRRLLSYLKQLSKASSDHEKKLIKENFAQQVRLDKLNAAKTSYTSLNTSMMQTISTTTKMIGAMSLAIGVIDRMGNSLLKSNQQYITFQKSTGISIGRLQRMAGIARLSGMNLAPEQVASDLQSLQSRIYDYAKGQETGIFSQLGIMPMGMKSDQLIATLRQRLKPYSEVVRSDILNQLGLSQEWLNVIDLSDEKFKEYLQTSQQLQLTEKERYMLAKYTEKQQKNNMRWELARQKITIALLPVVQEIMEFLSKTAVNVANITEKVMDLFNKNPAWLNVLKDVLLLLAGRQVIRTIQALGTLLGLGGLSALTGGLAKSGKAGGLVAGLLGGKAVAGAGKAVVGKTVAGRAGAFLGGPVFGTIANAVLFIPLIWDAIKGFFDKEDNKDEGLETDPVEQPKYQYHNIQSNMTNNFFSNPQPASAAINELNNAINRYTQYQYR